jgi:hypothetical protein
MTDPNANRGYRGAVTMNSVNEVWVLTINGKTTLHTSFTLAFFRYFAARSPKSLQRFVTDTGWVVSEYENPETER